jgi:hypothetical protein
VKPGRRLWGPRDLARFWSHVARNGDGSCWPWQGAVTSAGYGVFHLAAGPGGMWYAHRFAYRVGVGPIPDGQDVHHVCRCRSCCNPAHLALVPAPAHLAAARERRWRSRGRPKEGDSPF